MLELREVFLRQAAQGPGYAMAFALLEIAAAIDGLTEAVLSTAREPR